MTTVRINLTDVRSRDVLTDWSCWSITTCVSAVTTKPDLLSKSSFMVLMMLFLTIPPLPHEHILQDENPECTEPVDDLLHDTSLPGSPGRVCQCHRSQISWDHDLTCLMSSFSMLLSSCRRSFSSHRAASFSHEEQRESRKRRRAPSCSTLKRVWP